MDRIHQTPPPPTGAPIFAGPTPFNDVILNREQHVHKSYIWLGTLRAFLLVAFISFVSSAGSIVPLFFDNDPEAAFAMTIAFMILAVFLIITLVVVFLYRLVAYKHLRFIVGSDEFSLLSGIITKKRVHVPYDRIQSIDVRADLWQRIFGIRSLYIDTAGGASNKAITIPYLTKAQADRLTTELYSRKQQALNPTSPAEQSFDAEGNFLDIGKEAWDHVGGVFANDSATAAPFIEEPTFEYGLSNKELAFAGISNNTTFSFLVIAFIAAFSQIASLFMDIFPNETDNMLDQLTSAVSGPSLIFGSAFIIMAVVFGLLIAWIIALIGSFLQLGGFRARRMGNRVEVEHGLLQHTKQSVGVDRIQAIVIKQSAIRRLIGYCEISLDKIDARLESDNQQKNNLSKGVVVHPFCKLSDVGRIVNGLVPEYAESPDGLIKLPKVSLRRAIIRQCILQGAGFWLAIITLVSQLALNSFFDVNDPSVYLTLDQEDIIAVGILNYLIYVLYGISAALIIIDLINAILWSRESGFATNERFMKVINGGFSKEERCFPRNKIQYGFTKTNPFQQHSKVSTIIARTAAGIGGTSIKLKDAASNDALAWLAWLEPHAR